MKKYKIVKWLVLGIAIFAVISFLLPFLNYEVEMFELPEDGSKVPTHAGIYCGFNFLDFKTMRYVFDGGKIFAALTVISLLVALAAVAFAVLPLFLKDENGLNKNGKMHWSLIFSIFLSFASAILNLISAATISALHQDINYFYYNGHSYMGGEDCAFFTYINLILIVIASIAAIVLFVMSKRELVASGYIRLKEAVTKAENSSDSSNGATGASGDSEEQVSVVEDLLRPLPPDSLIGKPLEWFASEEGLETYKTYMTPQNYILQERILTRYKSISKGGISDYFLDMEYFERDYLPIANAGAKLPRRYFYALLKSIKAEPLKNPLVFDLVLAGLQLTAKPYVINDDGEPELRATVLTPEQIVSIDKNPLLYFVKNFNVFKMTDDEMGQVIDKFYAFNAVVRFILQFANEIEIEETKWLFDKDTYFNDFGMVRKIKGFIKKCKELTGNDKYNEFFDLVLEMLLSEMESSNT